MTEEELRSLSNRQAVRQGFSLEDCGWAELAYEVCECAKDIDALIAEVKRLRSLCGCLYDGLGHPALFCAAHRNTSSDGVTTFGFSVGVKPMPAPGGANLQKNLCAMHFEIAREGFHPGQKVPYCKDPKCQFIMP